MNKVVVVSVILAVLLVISVAQAVQINDLKDDLESGELVMQPMKVAVAPAAQPAALPSQPGCGI